MSNDPKLDTGAAIVFGLAYAASLHAFRSQEAAAGHYGREDHITPALDGIAAVRQWRHLQDLEGGEGQPAVDPGDGGR